MGVADGVYEWIHKNIDAGIYSRTMMKSAREAVLQGETDLIKILKRSYTKCQELKIQGSCTTCLLRLDLRTGTLQSVNVGDCGYVVLRKKKKKPKGHPAANAALHTIVHHSTAYD